MTISRRNWLAATGLTLAATRLGATEAAREPPRQGDMGFDPWLEIDRAALAHNVATLARLTGQPILAVAKNNAYGLGLEVAGPLLDSLPQVWGLAVVRAGEALTLRQAGVKKPVLLMGPASDEEQEELARREVRLAPYTASDAGRLVRLAARLGRPVPVHLYVDTGMHRMGLPHGELPGWLEPAELRRAIQVEGAFTELVEDQEFDRAQAARLRALASAARNAGVPLGRLHAASSDAILRPTGETFLDLVRPGLALYGGYPTAESQSRGELRLAYRMKAPVIRVDRLAPGDGVSYHHRYKATEPTWTATLAIGHVDGYPAGAVKGCEVLLGGRLCPVVGTVSASHTVVALGAEPAAQVGDVATLVGPEAPALHPNTIAARSGWSEYNMFMHLHPGLARRVVGG